MASLDYDIIEIQTSLLSPLEDLIGEYRRIRALEDTQARVDALDSLRVLITKAGGEVPEPE